MKRKYLVLPIILLMLFSLAACGSFIKTTKNTLYVAGTSYDLAMSTVSTLQKQGVVSDEQRVEVNGYANLFYGSYHLAVDALATYKKTQDPSDKTKLEIILNQLISNWSNLSAYVNRIRPGTLPESMEDMI